MAGGLTIQEAGDLLITTLPKLNRGKKIDTFLLQNYPFLESVVSDKMPQSGGTRFQKSIRLRSGAPSRGVNLYEVTPTSRVQVMAMMAAEWFHHEGKIMYDVRELAMNASDEERVIEWIKTQQDAEMEEICNYWELNGFLAPTSAGDTRFPLGMKYWIRGLGSGVTDIRGGFNGTTAVFRNGSTSSVVGNIDAAIPANERWRNWAFTHGGSLNMQTLRSMTTAMKRTRFAPPPGMKGSTNTSGKSKLRVYWNQQFSEDYEEIVNRGPDDRNGNASPFSGDLMYRDVQTVATPALDSEADAPILGVNHNHLYVITLQNMWMQKDKPINDVDQRHVFTQGIDSSGQIVCDNPRSCWIGHAVR